MKNKKNKIKLTQREKEVCRLLIGGFYYKEIAEHLGISEGTVDTHLRHVRIKTSSCNSCQLCAILVANNLLGGK